MTFPKIPYILRTRNRQMADKTGIRIIATGRALPLRSVSNNDLKAYMDTDDEWIYTRTGIRERRFCDPETEDTISMAVEAARLAIDKAQTEIPGFDTGEIGAVIATSCSASYMLPSIASMVQTELGLHKDILAYDLNAACSGFVFGLITGRGLLLAEGCKYCLVISSEQLSKELDLRDRSTGILFGDGAGAAIIELDKTSEAAAFAGKAWSDGNMEALRCAIYPGGTLAEDSPVRERKTVIEMNGHEVFRFAAAAVPQTIDSLLESSGMSLEDIDYILCHQANARIIDHVKKKYKGYEDKFLMNIASYGNTSSASIPILLDEMLERGVVKKNSKLLCVGFGAGLAWGGAIVNV